MKRLWLLSIVLPLLAGCEDRDLLSKGPNTAFRVTDTDERAVNHEKYIKLMCKMAMEGGACPAQPDIRWREVVFAALNDIDDRCEIYIGSLRQAYRDGRSEGGSFLNEALHISKASTDILGLTLDKKSGAKSIAIVGAAFGLTLKGAETYYSRLLLSVPPHNVQKLILKRQTSFRKVLIDNQYTIKEKDKNGKEVENTYYVVLKSKADAYHVIQSYLRICQPDTIEAAVLDSVEDFIDLTPVERALTSSAAIAIRTTP